MKAGEEHRIPLSGPAVALLDWLEPKGQADLIFQELKRRKPLSNMAMLKTMHRWGFIIQLIVLNQHFEHGYQKKTNHSNKVGDAAHAHLIANNVFAVYKRGDLFEERRTLMIEWSKFVTRLEEDIEASAVDPQPLFRMGLPF